MAILDKANIAVRLVIAASIVSVLAACQEDVSLLDEKGTVVGKGTLLAGASSVVSASFVVNEKTFTGSWKIRNVYDPIDDIRYRQMGSRSYETYTIGTTPDQLKLAHARLIAQDGTEMTCDFYYRRQPRIGTCDVGGTSLKLVMQHSPAEDSQQKMTATGLPVIELAQPQMNSDKSIQSSVQ